MQRKNSDLFLFKGNYSAWKQIELYKEKKNNSSNLELFPTKKTKTQIVVHVNHLNTEFPESRYGHSCLASCSTRLRR